MRLLRSDRAVEALQWFALLAAPLAWSGQLLVGYGLTVANCNVGNGSFGIDHDAWEIGATAAAGAVALLGEALAVLLYRHTRDTSYEDPPPPGRRRFFVAAAVAGNVLFLVIIVLSGLGALYHDPCRPA